MLYRRLDGGHGPKTDSKTDFKKLCWNVQLDKSGFAPPTKNHQGWLQTSAKTVAMSVLWYTLKHTLQSRHVESHDVNDLPRDKENNHYTVLPPRSGTFDTLHRWQNFSGILVINQYNFFIAYICAATPILSHSRSSNGSVKKVIYWADVILFHRKYYITTYAHDIQTEQCKLL